MNRLQLNTSLRWPLLIVVLLLATSSAATIHWSELIEIDPSEYPGTFYRIMIDPNGDYVLGEGDGYDSTWFYYPATGWWRKWFYNEPYDPERQGFLDYRAFISPYDYNHPSTFEINFNWTKPAWSALGLNRPPLPSDVPTESGEATYMDSYGFMSNYNIFNFSSIEPGKIHIISGYNPEWVSVDIRGENIHVLRGALHECRGKEGACCDHATQDCFMAYESDCPGEYDWMGPGTQCFDCTETPRVLMDFGDAPNSYKTLLANDGPRHTIVRGVNLGKIVDSESDGKPEPAALGDDREGSDDEDGVAFTSVLTPGERASVDVIASVPGYLNAWIDFNHDGTFDDRQEKIFTDERLSNGVNHLSFQMATGAASGDTFARFRFNTRGLLGPTGPAQDGEVEDYKVSIAQFYEPQPGSAKGAVKWSQPPKPSGASTPFVFTGWDEPSSLHLHQIVADDWQCTDERPVTGFHWWGSFEGWTKPLLPPVQPLAFHIAIWTNSPQSGMTRFAHPDTLVWETYCTHWAWNLAGTDDDPQRISQGETCFQFTYLLSQDQWFYQSPAIGPDRQPVPRTYWLSISAIYDTDSPSPTYPWGWTTRPQSSANAAVRITGTNPADGQQGAWPPGLNSRWLSGEPIQYPPSAAWDAAFELLTNQGGSDSGSGSQPTDKDLAPVYRFWSEKLTTHFYTISEADKNTLLKDTKTWTYEGIVFYAYPPDHQPTGSKPVYRFWSDSLGRHYYCMSESEKRQKMSESRVWTYEGIAWYAYDQAGTTKI